MDDQKQKTNSSKLKSPVKRKSEFTNCSSRENDKKKKFMCNNFGEDEKEQLKKHDKKKQGKKKCAMPSMEKKRKC